MKKIVISLIISIIILLQCTSVLATNFESIKMNIDLPDEYYDLKEGIDKNDSKIPYYETVLKTTKADMKKQFEQNSILYNGVSSNLSKQLIIAEAQNSLTKKIFHLNEATEEQMEKLKTELNLLATNQNMEITSQEIYTSNNNVFVYSVIKNSSLTIYQYYTIINGKGITISLNSSYSNTKKEELKEIIDTITFNELQEKPTDITNYIIIGISVILVIMMIILMYMAFFDKKKEE